MIYVRKSWQQYVKSLQSISRRRHAYFPSIAFDLPSRGRVGCTCGGIRRVEPLVRPEDGTIFVEV